MNTFSNIILRCRKNDILYNLLFTSITFLKHKNIICINIMYIKKNKLVLYVKML